MLTGTLILSNGTLFTLQTDTTSARSISFFMCGYYVLCKRLRHSCAWLSFIWNTSTRYAATARGLYTCTKVEMLYYCGAGWLFDFCISYDLTSQATLVLQVSRKPTSTINFTY